MITQNTIRAGMRGGIVSIINSPMNDGAVCQIGKDKWFYFGGKNAADKTADEYVLSSTQDMIVNDIYEMINDLCEEDKIAYEYCEKMFAPYKDAVKDAQEHGSLKYQELEMIISPYGHVLIKTGGKVKQYDALTVDDVGKAVMDFIIS